MARTFRRKNYEDTQGTSWDRQGRKIAGFYTEKDWIPGGRGYIGFYQFREPTDREKSKKFWELHGDINTHWYWNNPGPNHKKWRNKTERQLAKLELIKFFNNEEHEVQLNPRKSRKIWEYYD